MSEATAPLPRALSLEEQVARLTEVVEAGNNEVARFTRAIEQAAEAGLSVDPVAWEAVRRVGDRQGEARHLAGEITGLMAEMAVWKSVREAHEAAQAALAPEPAPVRRKGHRRAGQHRGLKVVPGFAPLAAFLRHGLPAAHATPAVKLGILAAATATTAVAVGGGVIAAHSLGSPDHPSASAAASPNPAASIFSASPISQRTPDVDWPIASLATRPTMDAKTAKGVTPSLVPPSWSPPSFQSPTSPQSSQSPQSQAPQQAQQSQGYIQAGTAAITVDDPTQEVQIPITATGGDTSWNAWITGPSKPDVTLDPGSTEGDLPAGTGAYLHVTIDSAAQLAGGTVTVHVWPGDVEVVLTWQPVTPAVVSSPAVTVSVTPSPASS